MWPLILFTVPYSPVDITVIQQTLTGDTQRRAVLRVDMPENILGELKPQYYIIDSIIPTPLVQPGTNRIPSNSIFTVTISIYTTYTFGITAVNCVGRNTTSLRIQLGESHIIIVTGVFCANEGVCFVRMRAGCVL
jgi:hypothetical protein